MNDRENQQAVAYTFRSRAAARNYDHLSARRPASMVARLLLGASLCGAVTACSGKVGGKEHEVAKWDQWRQYKDATQRPGAIVIYPKFDPYMIYDPETKRVTDQRTGDYFSFGQMDGMNRLYRGAIHDRSGKVLSEYEARYGGSRLPDGEEKSVYEVFWTLRGEDSLKMIREQIAGRERAKNDSLERLASFLRARSIGHYNGVEKGEIALVDRRMDDTQRERYN